MPGTLRRACSKTAPARRAVVAAALACAILLACAGSATAAVRWAAPGATGPEPCVKANPCSIYAAATNMGGQGAQVGDEVRLEPGEYSDTAGDLGPQGTVPLQQGISFGGVPGKRRPVIRLDGNQDSPALTVGANNTVSNLEIDSAARSSSIYISDGIVSNLVSRAAGQGAVACLVQGGLVRQSACLSSGANGVALGSPGFGAPHPTNSVKLRDVTAAASGAGSTGLSYFVINSNPAVIPSFDVDGIGVIARGAGKDVVAEGLSQPPHTPGTGASVDVRLSHSDYATTATATDAGGGSATISPSGDGTTNLEAAPLLADDGYHQLPGSPTVDAGGSDGLTGNLDVDGQERILGPTSDIGADELAVATTTGLSCAPDLSVGGLSTCTATVEAAAGGVPPLEGEVDVESSDGGAFVERPCRLLVTGLIGSCQVRYIPSRVGSQRITASYPGDRNHDPSQGAFQGQAVEATSTAVSCTPDPVRVGVASTCTAIVTSPPRPDSTPATGSVAFSSDGQGSFSSASCQLAAATATTASCQATYAPTAVGSGRHTIKAVYQGDETHEATQGTTPLRVGAVRYAAPGGTGQEPCEDPADRCSLQDAVGGAPGALNPGDEVLLAPGTYSEDAGDFGPGLSVALGEGVTISGELGGPRPVIEVDQGAGPVLRLGNGATARHLEIDSSTAETDLEVSSGGIAEGVVARLSKAGAITCTQADGLIRESACLSSGDRGVAVGSILTRFANGLVGSPKLRDVTAVASGADSHGLRYSLSGLISGHPRLEVDAAGVIAIGKESDIEAVEASPSAETSASMRITLDHSDYASASTTSAQRGGTLEVTTPGQGSNLKAAPQLKPDGYHELLTSPTLDRGAVSPLSGEFDLDGQHRALGQAPDIGADEVGHQTSVSLSCSPHVLGLAPGNSTRCTATVADLEDSPSSPTGVVEMSHAGQGTFGAGGATCSLSAAGAGKARCQVVYTPTAAGPQLIQAAYQGGQTHDGAEGQAAITVGAIRFAAPGGHGADPCADPAHPCSVYTAANQSHGAEEGDEVVLAPGSYSDVAGDFGPNGSVELAEGISVHGADGQARPVLTTTAAAFSTLSVARGDVVSHLAVNMMAASNAIFVAGGTVEDLVVRSGPAAVNSITCFQLSGVVRDTACLNSAERGVAAGVSDAASRDDALTLRNVTAVATGVGSAGLLYSVSGPNTIDVDASSVIASGTRNDVIAEGLRQTGTNAGSVHVHLDHSDYATVATLADPGGVAEVTLPGAGANITDPALLEADGYHELATSPTVDHGAIDELSGEFDPDGQLRTLGAAADIGADEQVAPTPVTVSCSPASVPAGGPTSCTATVGGPAAAGVDAPIGSVDFSSDGGGRFSAPTCQLASAAGKTSCKVTYTPSRVGAEKITASYRGDTTHGSGQAETQLTAASHQTSTTLTCDPAGVKVGAGPVTCTATVADLASAPSAPGGVVKLASSGQGSFATAGACSLAGAVGGKASCKVTYTPSAAGSGTHTITASYQGDASHLASQGSGQVAVQSAAGGRAPDTKIGRKPRRKTAKRRAVLTFSADQAGSTFQCKLDRKPFRPCRSPFKKTVAPGRHTFQVRAVSRGGVADPTPAMFRWRVGGA